ncbi:MAG: DUF5908 family protein [Synechococcaceae cyanobacterium]|nr:DUF5908 family protein [Synechococcaceae cyanobacterium]
MTIELRQLIIRAVVTTPNHPPAPVNEAELVNRCTRLVMRKLARLKER